MSLAGDPDLGPIRMGSVICQIEAVLWDPQMEHPWRRMLARHLRGLESWWSVAEPPATVALEFLTPTAFARSYSFPGGKKRSMRQPFHCQGRCSATWSSDGQPITARHRGSWRRCSERWMRAGQRPCEPSLTRR